MTQYNNLIIKLKELKLNELISKIKTTGVTLMLLE